MSWFNSNKDNAFDSMRLPELPELPERKSLPDLPSFPSNATADQFNNQMVKAAVTDSSGENRGVFEEAKSSGDYFSTSQPVQQSFQKPKTNELVFVRIDKFQEAQKDFNDVKRKVKEIESLLKEVKEINQKEDIQTGEWVRDLEKVKMLLIEIDSKVFNQL